jgi:acyl-ACP thioesterase
MNTLSSEFKISSYDLNPKGRARLTTMAGFFQEVAYHHANELGLGYDAMKSRRHIWVLSRMRIRMHRYPVWNERIILETWPSGAEKLFALRDFRVLDSQDEVIGMASTAWLIVDMDTHRLIRPKEIIKQFKMIIHDKHMFRDPLEKINIPGEPVLLNQHTVVYSDLDIVGHVNNVRYMEWCIDAATTATDVDRDIFEFEINFNHEALLGDRIHINAYDSGKGETFFQATREGDGKEIICASLKRN